MDIATFDPMENMNILITDLNKSSRLAPALQSIFETGDIRARFYDPSKIRELGQSASNTGNGNNVGILILILPEAITEAERALIRTLSRQPVRMPIIAVIKNAGANEVVELFKLGVTDFITPPLRAIDVMPRILRLAEHIRKKSSLTERLKETVGLRQIIAPAGERIPAARFF